MIGPPLWKRGCAPGFRPYVVEYAAFLSSAEMTLNSFLSIFTFYFTDHKQLQISSLSIAIVQEGWLLAAGLDLAGGRLRPSLSLA